MVLTICYSFSPYSLGSCSQRGRVHGLRMIFDFIKRRSEEGIAQIQNIATKTLEGKLGDALSESADYIRERQRIDNENLKKLAVGLSRSRDRLLLGIADIFSPEKDLGLNEQLEMLENVLLQADIGSATTATIIDDLSNE